MTGDEVRTLLEQPTCSYCGNVGSVSIKPEDDIPGNPLRVTCTVCNGTLREPTEAGWELLAFLRNHGLVEIRPRPRLPQGQPAARPGEP